MKQSELPTWMSLFSDRTMDPLKNELTQRMGRLASRSSLMVSMPFGCLDFVRNAVRLEL